MQPAGERRRLHRPTFLSRKIRTNCRLNIRLLFIKYIANKTLLTDFEKPCWLSGCLAAYIFTTRIHTATCFLKYLWNMQWPTYVLFIFQDVSFTRYTYLLQSLDVNDMLLSHLRLFGVWTGWAVTVIWMLWGHSTSQQVKRILTGLNLATCNLQRQYSNLKMYSVVETSTSASYF